MAPSFTAVDWVVVAAYLGAVLGLGLFWSRGQSGQLGSLVAVVIAARFFVPAYYRHPACPARRGRKGPAALRPLGRITARAAAM